MSCVQILTLLYLMGQVIVEVEKAAVKIRKNVVKCDIARRLMEASL